MGVPKTMGFSTKIFQHDLILDDFVGTPILGPLWVWFKIQKLTTYPKIGWSTLKNGHKNRCSESGRPGRQVYLKIQGLNSRDPFTTPQRNRNRWAQALYPFGTPRHQGGDCAEGQGWHGGWTSLDQLGMEM